MGSKFVWYDVAAREPDAVREFYAGLFDWPIGPDLNPGPYNGWIMDGERPWAAVVEADDARPVGGSHMSRSTTLTPRSRRRSRSGASVVLDKTDGPAGTAVTIADPGGALVALWVPFPVAN